jgi:hypothetical protein
MKDMAMRRTTFIREDPFKKYVKPRQKMGLNANYDALRIEDNKMYNFHPIKYSAQHQDKDAK